MGNQKHLRTLYCDAMETMERGGKKFAKTQTLTLSNTHTHTISCTRIKYTHTCIYISLIFSPPFFSVFSWLHFQTENVTLFQLCRNRIWQQKRSTFGWQSLFCQSEREKENVCVCVWKGERKRMCVCVCVCVCVWKGERRR